MKKSFLLIAFSLLSIFFANAQRGPFPPAAGIEGSTAISKDSQLFKAWASGIELTRGYVDISDPFFTYDGSNKATFGMPSAALGVAEGNSMDVVSLGDAGIATLTFDFPIINGAGADFAVFENSFSDTFLELAFVEVSSDGKRFVRFPAVSLTDPTIQVGSFGNIDPTNIHNFAGKYRQGFGTPFDLEDIKDSIGIDINNIRFIRIIDVVGSIDPQYATYDSKGNIVNDPFPTPFASSGFDFDGIGVINIGNKYLNSNFNNLTLNADSYWNGNDNSGGFTDVENIFYSNTYNSSFESWNGFAYSNMRDDSTGTFMNMYSSITSGGIDATTEKGTNYAVAFVPGDWNNNYQPIPSFLKTVDEKSYLFNGFYITNNTYAYFSMKNGDGFAKKFGGETGQDPDFLKVLVWGITEDNSTTDTVEFYLADYRFEDSSDDYIVDNWRWVDLTSLGKVKQVNFSMNSSDKGDFGINTPTYFCIDNVTIDISNTQGVDFTNKIAKIDVYPNPATDIIKFNCDENDIISLFDLNGKLIHKVTAKSSEEAINIETLKSGLYVVSIANGKGIGASKFIKK